MLSLRLSSSKYRRKKAHVKQPSTCTKQGWRTENFCAVARHEWSVWWRYFRNTFQVNRSSNWYVFSTWNYPNLWQKEWVLKDLDNEAPFEQCYDACQTLFSDMFTFTVEWFLFVYFLESHISRARLFSTTRACLENHHFIHALISQTPAVTFLRLRKRGNNIFLWTSCTRNIARGSKMCFRETRNVSETCCLYSKCCAIRAQAGK